MIEANIIHSAYEHDVKRLLFLGSTCIYPRDVKQPMSEDALLTDVLEPTNEPYAIAKISGIKLCESYNRQYGVDFRSVMPTNLYGINDNFHSENSHVVPSLLRKFHEAKVTQKSNVEVWGSGKAMREFLFVDDMADASIFVLELNKQIYLENTKLTTSHINIGTGIDISIQKLAVLIKKVVGFDGEILFDQSKPDGAPRKLVDVSLIEKMGWTYSTEIEDGLIKTYKWFKDNEDNIKK